MRTASAGAVVTAPGPADNIPDVASRVLDRSLDWLARNADQFSLTGADASADVERPQLAHKALSELAIFLVLARRTHGWSNDGRLTGMVEVIARAARTPGLCRAMARRPNFFPTYLMLHCGLTAWDVDSPQTRTFLQRVVNFGFIDRIERNAWEQIDMCYYMDFAGLDHDFPPLETLYQATSVHRLLPLPLVRRIDAYAATHVLFHLSDFGRRDLASILGDRLEPTQEWIAALLGLFLRRRDWDLVGELLMTCEALRFRPALHALAWTSLEAAQGDDGEIQAHLFDPTAPELDDPLAAGNYRFRHNYHPTLVGALCGLVTLDRAT